MAYCAKCGIVVEPGDIVRDPQNPHGSVYFCSIEHAQEWREERDRIKDAALVKATAPSEPAPASAARKKRTVRKAVPKE